MIVHLLVVYDIASSPRREAVSGVLAARGFRVQFSVFEYEVESVVERTRLAEHLSALIDPVEDQIRIYVLTSVAGVPERIVLGQREIEEPRGFWLL